MEELPTEPLIYAWRADAPRNPRPKKQTFTASLKGAPIVIDNGSYHCRVGWAHAEAPALDFRALLNRPKSKASPWLNHHVGVMLKPVYTVDWIGMTGYALHP